VDHREIVWGCRLDSSASSEHGETGFHKMPGICWAAERLFLSEEGCSSVLPLALRVCSSKVGRDATKARFTGKHFLSAFFFYFSSYE
jgi:hypothetical protein